jgi:FtsP/CotA-like multicopper oxidase with cupredoxin domain
VSMKILTVLKRTARYAGPLMVIAALLFTPLLVSSPVRASLPGDGILCTSNPSSTFTLTTMTGTILTPDGNSVFMWSLTEMGKPFQYPGPVLCVREGDQVTVVLKNSLPEATSLIFPGQDAVLANGLPSNPDGLTQSLTAPAPTNGSMTYSFVASRAGTYLYMSGTSQQKQVQMGLFGMLVVRPAPVNGATIAYETASGDLSRVQYNPNTEFMTLVSEIDPIYHQKVEIGLNPSVVRTASEPGIHPRYWMINGRAFPDTVAPNNAHWLPNQPYGSLVHINVQTAANPYPALVRYASVASGIVPFHPHGANGRMIARNGSLLEGSLGQDMSFEKYSIPLATGQTWDSLFAWSDVEGYNPTTNPVPALIPSDSNLTIGPYWSGSPYLGTNDPLPPGTITYNQCGEYYHVAHSHALQQITSWGISMSGALTLTRIDPAAPNNCP